MSPRKGCFRVGTSGYQYDHWKGVIYPKGVRRKDWFAHYTTLFDTVEINNTFYHLPRAKTFDSWKRQAPEGFCYVLKFSRYGTHVKRLRSPRGVLRKFLARAERLQEFLGPILVQLPPNWNVNTDRLADFLEAAPGRRRWAIEFRDRRWLCREVFQILEARNAALCIHDMIPQHPRRLTADWVYLRFHGIRYGGCYTPQTLAAQARDIKGYLAEGMDVFVYFNNDAEGYAVRNAMDLRRYVAGG